MLYGTTFAADAPPAPFVRVQGESNSAHIARDRSAIVCRTLPRETGMRMGARQICHTAAEWEAQSREGQDATRTLQPTMGRPPGG